jgi:hypothetical protein
VTGTVAGTPLTVASVVAAPGWSSESGACTVSEADGGDVTCPSSFSRSVSVVFTNRSDATCAAIQSDVASNTTFEYANFDYLAVSVNVANGDVVAGTYEIVASQSSNVTGAAASFVTTSSTCVATPLSATTGTVTLTQVSASSVAGTYNATFGAQGTFQGSFDTAICVFDAGSASTPAKQICQP